MVKQNKELWGCRQCKGTNVSEKRWVYVNDEDQQESLNDNEYWCDDCLGLFVGLEQQTFPATEQ